MSLKNLIIENCNVDKDSAKFIIYEYIKWDKVDSYIDRQLVMLEEYDRDEVKKYVRAVRKSMTGDILFEVKPILNEPILSYVQPYYTYRILLK